MTPKQILGLAIAASTLASSAALAATGTPERVRGTITSATANSVTVDTHADKPVTVSLTGNTSYLKVEKANLNKVEKGSLHRHRNQGCRRHAGRAGGRDLPALDARRGRRPLRLGQDPRHDALRGRADQQQR